MWLALSGGAKQRLSLVDRQAIWPASDGTDAELIITARAQLDQEVVLATTRVTRLRYSVVDVGTTVALDESDPRPWLETEEIIGEMFEIMITERGAMVVPAKGPRLANRHANWLATLAEDVRSAWPLPPDDAVAGSRWHAVPALPGGLPPGTSTAAVDVTYLMKRIEGRQAEVGVQFSVMLQLDTVRGVTGEGTGEMTIHVNRDTGLTHAIRQGAIELRRTARRTEALRSKVEIMLL